MDKVTVVIPTYKRPERLKKTVESVFRQTFTNIEIIIVDDNNPGSEERKNTEAAVEVLLTDKRIKYIKHEKNMGAPAARNTGLKYASCTFISFLDDDDYLFPTKIEKQVNLFKEKDNEKLAIVYCKNNYLDDNDKILRYSVANVRGNAVKYQLLRNIAITSTMLFKKDIVEEVHGFRDLICGQEYDLVLRILLNGYEVDYVDEILTSVYLHDEERINTNEKIIKGREYLLEIKKNHFNLLTKKEINRILNSHNLTLCREYILLADKKTAFWYFIKSVKNRPLNMLNYIEGLSFFIKYSSVIKIKKLLHILLNKAG